MELRPELPRPIPNPIEALPRDRGYPVPWFVAWLIEGTPVARGRGKPDFRVTFPGAVQRAAREQLCWVCGRTLLGSRAYVVGPMCAVNRTSAEPPSHIGCAEWSARACPFLVRPHARRRDNNLPVGEEHVPGKMIARNPGVAMVWKINPPVVVKYIDPRNEGYLFDLGDPLGVTWWAEGRAATREEVMESIESGLPLLREAAERDEEHEAGALDELDRYIGRALRLVERTVKT